MVRVSLFHSKLLYFKQLCLADREMNRNTNNLMQDYILNKKIFNDFQRAAYNHFYEHKEAKTIEQ